MRLSTTVARRCWKEEQFPDCRKEPLVVGIYKKGAAKDPANYRPISLLLTAYKLLGRTMACRLQAALDAALSHTQFGFRRGQSMAEPIFIIRRTQDLIIGRQHQALHLLFLDWSKAFHQVDASRLAAVMGRYGAQPKMIRVVAALVGDPVFRVAMAGQRSRLHKQETGIRQGCTLSPFLFTLILSAVMRDAVSDARVERPLATTPVIPVMDLECADDTVLIARTSDTAEALLANVVRRAAPYGQQLNEDKTRRIACGTDEQVRYPGVRAGTQGRTRRVLGGSSSTKKQILGRRSFTA